MTKCNRARERRRATPPPMTQVYGGAGRVYGVDHDWVTDPHRSPLRFAYSAADSARVVAQLTSDAMAVALRAGLVGAGPQATQTEQDGVVLGLVGERALVTLANGSMATIWADLTVPGVPLEHLVSAGQPVTGTVDGAVCWRVALQRDTPSARRLHFWLHGETIELSRVVAHDDMAP